jgi:hypothetical protein
MKFPQWLKDALNAALKLLQLGKAAGLYKEKPKPEWKEK